MASVFVAAYAFIHTYGVVFENKYEVINETLFKDTISWFSPNADHADYTAVPMV
jgi:hypothetical protein